VKTAQWRQVERVSKRKCRLENDAGGEVSFFSPGHLCGHVNRSANAGVGSAAAEVSGHGVINIGV